MANIVNNQLYELRPVADPTKNMAIGSSSHVNGAKAIIYPILDINDQKWRFSADGNNWRIYNVESDKQAVVWWPTSASPFVDGQEIVQWEGGSTNAVWTAVKVGDTTVDGVECPIIAIKNTAYPSVSLSTSDAIYYGSNLVKLATTDTAAQTQQWICVPTVARGDIPSPYNVKITGTTEKNAASSISFPFYGQWSMASSYAADQSVTYQVRTRYRKMGLNNAWGSWSGWGAWSDVSVARSGQTFTESASRSMSLNSSQKLAQAELEVRAIQTIDGSVYASPSASTKATFYPKPVVTMSAASWTPDGIDIAASSTYTSRGPTTVYVESIKQNGKELLPEPVSSTLIASGDAVHVPQDALIGIPADGTGITVKYRVGTDQKAKFSGTSSANVPLSYDAGSPTVTVTDTSGFTKTVTVANSDDAKVWVLYDGKIVECPNGVVAYPFGKDYEVFASGTYGNPASQFAWHANYTGTAHGVHAWNWDGGSASLQIREGEPIIVDDSIEAVYESFDLAARPYETVSFAETRHHKFTAEGAVIEGKTESGRADFELVAGIHATYRSPRGDVVPVAILSVSRESHKNWTEIDVTMVRESE